METKFRWQCGFCEDDANTTNCNNLRRFYFTKVVCMTRGARPLEPRKPKTWTTKLWKLRRIRFDLDNQERFVIRASLHLVVDKKQQQQQEQFLTSHVACNRFTMAFSRTEFPSEIRYKKNWPYLFYHGVCRDDLFLVILPNKTHSLIITIVVATLSLVNSK
mgnify:CR=1 FL=1